MIYGTERYKLLPQKLDFVVEKADYAYYMYILMIVSILFIKYTQLEISSVGRFGARNTSQQSHL